MDTPEELEAAAKECEDHAEMYRERLLATEFGLWSTLTAIDGLFISAASVIAAFGGDAPRWVLLCIVAAASISIVLLVWNFHARRAMYRILGVPPPRTIYSDVAAASAYFQAFQAEQAKHRRAQKSSEKRETVCYLLLVTCLFLLAYAAYAAGSHVELPLG